MSKKIVITGAGAGLGRALARRFAKDGDVVILLGRTLKNVEKVAAEIGGAAMAVECDVASADSVRKAFAAVAAKHAKIDALINNAAVYEPVVVSEATDAQIETHLMTNFAGPIYCARAAIPMLGRGGSIINVSSESVVVPFAMFALYHSTKAGLERFSEALKAELDPAGIRVSVVRAGQMMDADKTWNIDPAVARRFGEACMKAGVNLRERPLSQYVSVTDVFRLLIDLPADLRVSGVFLEAHRP
ncbi:MAG: SDR family oxidoreductase [Parvularculaceae bacterium]|nr:SDR family oxidoreductase [Parvularculaceae bacterium]